MSEPDPEIIALERRASEGGIRMNAALQRVGVAPTTWWRWREGKASPMLHKLRAVREAVEAEIAAQG